MHLNSDHDRLTLQEYMQTYNMKKKLEDRKRSRSKGQEPPLASAQTLKMKGLFVTVDQYLEEGKAYLEDVLINTDTPRDKIFFLVSKMLDDLVGKLKVEVAAMYKEVYIQTSLEQGQGEGLDFLREKMQEAEKEKHKISLGEVVRTNFKREEKQAELVHLILGDTIKNAEKVTASRYAPVQESKETKDSPPPPHQSTYRLKPPTVTLLPKSTPSSKPSSPASSDRPNSFMDALFQLSQPANSPSDDYQLRPQPSKFQQTQLATAAELPAPRPFERRPSKTDLRSPRPRPALKKVGSP